MNAVPAVDSSDAAALQTAVQTLETIILGKPAQVRLCLACLLARGHLLIEDVPGVGKTTLAHALAHVLGLAWHRVQFTSDLLPADIVGVSVFDRATQQFHFRQGPDLHATPASRRGKPRKSADAERTSRGHGRASGQRGPDNLSPARAFFCRRNPEPARTARHLLAAGVATRPIPDARHARLS